MPIKMDCSSCFLENSCPDCPFINYGKWRLGLKRIKEESDMQRLLKTSIEDLRAIEEGKCIPV